MREYTWWEGVLINCTQMFGQIYFRGIKGEAISPDESTCAYVWRRGYEGWIMVLDSVFGENHCKEAYMSEKLGKQQAPEYRQKFDEESA